MHSDELCEIGSFESRPLKCHLTATKFWQEFFLLPELYASSKGTRRLPAIKASAVFASFQLLASH